jgi:dihydrofolate reductase
VSHRPRPPGWHPEASFHFATSVEEGIARAQELAGEREIGVGAGEVGGQALSRGLIDHVTIDVVPVVFGRGKPYFGALADGYLMLDDPEVVIQGDGVLHLRCPVHRGR